MGPRFVVLGDGRRVTLGSYVSVVKAAKSNPNATFSRCLEDRWPAAGSQIMHQFRAGMVERINHQTPYHARGAGL